MKDMELILTLIEVVLVISSFLLGKYVFPKYKNNIQSAAVQFEVLLKYAESYCAYARKFLTNLSGAEKMDAVIDKLQDICDNQGIEVDSETLRAIAQKAYDAMKAGEAASKVIIENAVSELELISNNTKSS